MGFPGSSAGKEPACNAGDLGLILSWEDPLEDQGTSRPHHQGPAAINQMGTASHFQAILLQVDGVFNHQN